MPESTQIPSSRVPVIDPKTGLMSREWYRFFFSVYTLTGSGQNTITLSDLTLAPPAYPATDSNQDFPACTVAELGPPLAAGTRRFVTDSLYATFLTVAEGSGFNALPVVSDGTNWIIG